MEELHHQVLVHQFGGAGGNGAVRSGNSSGYGQVSLGGTGNPSGSYATYRYSATNYVGRWGTGGLLIMYADNLYNSGTISSNGVSSSSCGISNSNGRVDPGGASGGGSVNIFANRVTNISTMTAAGGAAITLYSTGGAGGNGTVTVNELAPDLVCSTKQVILKTEETYQIDKSKISLVNKNVVQSDEFTLGELSFASLDENIVTVDSEGKITAINEGRTKIEIIDTKNNFKTYIFVEVRNTPKIDVQEGKNFTIALKQDGTVWNYGSINGVKQTTQTKINGLENIQQIATGYSHSLALAENRRSICMGYWHIWTVRKWRNNR